MGPEQVIVTNLDPVQEIKDGTVENIKKRVQELYREVGNPLMVGAGCEIPPATPYENLQALCRAGRLPQVTGNWERHLQAFPSFCLGVN